MFNSVKLLQAPWLQLQFIKCMQACRGRGYKKKNAMP